MAADDRDNDKKPPRLTRWWEEYLGLKYRPQWVVRKTGWAYLSSIVASLAVFTGISSGPQQTTVSQPTTPVQARPQDVEPHVPSQSRNTDATLEVSALAASANSTGGTLSVTASGHLSVSGELSTVVIRGKKPTTDT